MKKTLFCLLVMFLLPTEGHVSSVQYTAKSLHDIHVKSKLIVVARHLPVLPDPVIPTTLKDSPYYEIERVVVDREGRGNYKPGARIQVFDANREQNEALGRLMAEQGLNTPPYSPVYEQYENSMTPEEFAAAERVLLFLVPYKDRKDEFMFAMDRGYDHPAKAKDVIEAIK